jgi:hypothetical protein
VKTWRCLFPVLFNHRYLIFNRWTARSICKALTVLLHGRVMIIGVGIDWQRHCGQFEHYTLQSSPFLPSPSLSLPLVVSFQKCKHPPLEGSDNLYRPSPRCYKKMLSPSYLFCINIYVFNTWWWGNSDTVSCRGILYHSLLTCTVYQRAVILNYWLRRFWIYQI